MPDSVRFMFYLKNFPTKITNRCGLSPLSYNVFWLLLHSAYLWGAWTCQFLLPVQHWWFAFAGSAVMKERKRGHRPALCPNNDTPRPALTLRCYPLCNSRQPPFPCLLLCHTRTASTLLPAVYQYLSLSSPARCPSALRQRPTAPHLLCAVSLEAVTTPPPAQTHVGICCCFPVNRIGYVHQSKLALSYIIIVWRQHKQRYRCFIIATQRLPHYCERPKTREACNPLRYTLPIW